MGGDIQVLCNLADLIPIPVSAHEEVPVFPAQVFQELVQIPSQFFGIIKGFHGRQCRNGFFQLIQGNIVVAVTFLGCICVEPLQTYVSGNPAGIGTQVLWLRRRDSVPDGKICIARRLFCVLCILENIRCHFSDCRSIFADQFCNCPF